MFNYSCVGFLVLFVLFNCALSRAKERLPEGVATMDISRFVVLVAEARCPRLLHYLRECVLLAYMKAVIF